MTWSANVTQTCAECVGHIVNVGPLVECPTCDRAVCRSCRSNHEQWRHERSAS